MMKLGLITLAMLCSMPAMAQTQQRFYDNFGRSIGTATTDSQGATTFRDSRGVTTGTATTTPSGTTTFRDSRGVTTGTTRR